MEKYEYKTLFTDAKGFLGGKVDQAYFKMNSMIMAGRDGNWSAQLRPLKVMAAQGGSFQFSSERFKNSERKKADLRNEYIRPEIAFGDYET